MWTNEKTTLMRISALCMMLLSSCPDRIWVDAFALTAPSSCYRRTHVHGTTSSSSWTLMHAKTIDRKWKRHPALFLRLMEQDESDSQVDETDQTNQQNDAASKSSIPSRASYDAVESMNTEQLMEAIGTSPRRIVLSFLSASTIALGANFLGITSHFLEALPDSAVEATGLDTFYPRGDYKRYRSDEGYAFIFPKEWVTDTGLEVAKAQLRSKNLDLTMKKIKRGILPDAAFGPPGRLNDRGVSSGDTNVSVIVSPVMKGFSLLGTLGEPTAAAEQLLSTSLAPPNSGRTATLLDAIEDSSRGVYQFEYEVDRGERGPPLRAISVIAEQHRDTLLTMTVVAPKRDWENASYQAKLRTIARSFHLL